MFNVKELDQIVFFDLETVPITQNLEILEQENPALAKVFQWFCHIRAKTPEQTCEEVFQDVAGLIPEYLKIVCFSYAKISWNEDYTSYKLIKDSYAGPDEKDLLDSVCRFLEKTSARGFKIGGHNIKEFDIPVLIKRLLINGMTVPGILWDVVGKKPWETRFVDTKDIWKFGSFSQKNSLMEIAVALGLKSPKDIMAGENVKEEFYVNQDIEKIAEYCEGDAATVANIMIKMSNYTGKISK